MKMGTLTRCHCGTQSCVGMSNPFFSAQGCPWFVTKSSLSISAMIFVIVPELRVDELGSDECVVDRVGNLTVVTVQANLPGIPESILGNIPPDTRDWAIS